MPERKELVQDFTEVLKGRGMSDDDASEGATVLVDSVRHIPVTDGQDQHQPMK